MKNDELFWQKLRKGDKNAVKEMFQLNVPLLIKYGCRFTDNEAIIDECIVDIFVNLWKNRQTLQKDALKIYLMESLKKAIKAKLQQPHFQRA